MGRWGRGNYKDWALVTGEVSGVIVLDFDGERGTRLMRKWKLRPTVKTPSGGFHVWIYWPGFKCKNGQVIPGLELKDGLTATFYGEGRERGGGPIYRFSTLPADLRRLIRSRKRTVRRAKSTVDANGSPEPLPAVMQLALERLKDRKLRQVKEREWEACCPAHNERQPSFNIGLGNDRLIVVHCFSRECSKESIAEALDMDPAWFSDEPWDSDWRKSPAYGLISDVERKKVRWLWAKRIPLAKPSIFEGDPGRGKSSIALDLAARVSTGREMPDGPSPDEPGPGAVLVISAEDDIEDTIRPRLEAYGADLTRIGFIPLRKEAGNVVPLTIPDDLSRIRDAVKGLEKITKLPVNFIIIDPISAYLGENVNTHNDASVRRALTPLAQLAQELGSAVFMVRHLNKHGGLKAEYRGGGSIAFTAIGRSVMVVDAHPEIEGRYVLARVKNNLAPDVKSLAYEVVSNAEFDVPQVKWGELVDMDAHTLLRGRDGRTEAPELKEACELLNQLLAGGPMSLRAIEREMKLAKISMTTAKRAKKRNGIISKRVRSKQTGKTVRWDWMLPHAGKVKMKRMTRGSRSSR